VTYPSQDDASDPLANRELVEEVTSRPNANAPPSVEEGRKIVELVLVQACVRKDTQDGSLPERALPGSRSQGP